MQPINSLLEQIGRTPLLKLNRVGRGVPANVYVKLEYLNPSGSYKDRMALAMIEAAEQGKTWNRKRLMPGGTVCDASAGNCAPALAFVCALKGYKARLGIYKPMLRGSSTRLKITGAYGPDVYECNPPSAYLNAADEQKFLRENHDITYIVAGKMQAYEMELNDPDVVWVDQIYNPYNAIGQQAIGREILDQLDGRVDAFGCAVGSGATLFGVTAALAAQGLKPYTFGVVPHGSEVYMELDQDESHQGEFRVSSVMQRLVRAMGLIKWQREQSIIETMLAQGYPDSFLRVTTEEARAMANRLCREEGIYCGMSSGANVCAALKTAARLEPGQNVVTVIVDRRDRYLGEYPEEVFIV